MPYLRLRYFFAALLVCIVVASSNNVQAAESLLINLDNKQWEQISDPNLGNFFVPKGQTLSDWTVMMTIIATPYSQATPELKAASNKSDYLESFYQSDLRKIFTNIMFSTLAKTPKELLCEYRILGNSKALGNYNLKRTLLGKEAYYTLELSFKNPGAVPEVRAQWLPLLKSAKLGK